MSLDSERTREIARLAREEALKHRVPPLRQREMAPEKVVPHIADAEPAANPLDKLCYRPNEIPWDTRMANGAMSAAIIAYGYWGVHVDDLYIPGKRGRGIHFHALSAWIMYAAMLCAAAHLIGVIVDHYDHRDNERRYQQFATYAQGAGWTLAVLSFVIGLIYRQIN